MDFQRLKDMIRCSLNQSFYTRLELPFINLYCDNIQKEVRRRNKDWRNVYGQTGDGSGAK